MSKTNIPVDFGKTAYINNKKCHEDFFERIISGKVIDNPMTEQTKEERDYDNYLKEWLSDNDLTVHDFICAIANIQERLFIEKRKPICTRDAYEVLLVEGIDGKIWDSKAQWLEHSKEIDLER